MNSARAGLGRTDILVRKPLVRLYIAELSKYVFCFLLLITGKKVQDRQNIGIMREI